MKYGQFVEAAGEFARQINFLAKAVSDDDSDRLFTKYINIEPSEKEPGRLLGVSSDGKRLHRVDPLSCPNDIGVQEGAWHVLRSGEGKPWIVELKGDVGTFPNWKNVIPKDKPVFEGAFKGIPVDNRNMDGYVLGGLVDLFRSFPEPTLLNLNYLYDLGTDDEWDIEWHNKNKALVFYSGVMTAVIMPCWSGE
jgi:hypothetical protein